MSDNWLWIAVAVLVAVYIPLRIYLWRVNCRRKRQDGPNRQDQPR